MNVQLRVVSADAIMLYFPDTLSAEVIATVGAAANAVEHALGSQLVDLIPSYSSLLVIFDPLVAGHTAVAGRLRNALRELQAAALPPSREVSLPVYYAPEAGPDLEALAERAKLSVDDLVALHSGRSYRVYAIGFAPGFAYLGEVDERIAAPRRATPRQRVPRGAVAIADRQTAVYPAASPGGWNLIGLCPTTLFDPQAQQPMPVAVGDQVNFVPVTRAEFLAQGGTLP